MARKYPEAHEYLAPRKHVLVLSCVDARLLDDLVRFLDHDNLTNRYYHCAFAGAALGLAEKKLKKPPKNLDCWRPTFKDHVQAAVLLTKGEIRDVYIVHHEDCGAFRVYLDLGDDPLKPDAERALHREYALALQKDIRSSFDAQYNPTDPETKKPVQKKPPAVHSFFMDLRGNVELLETTAPGYPGASAAVRPPRRPRRRPKE